MALYEIKNIVANPFRHIKRYPIKRDKVAALRESLQKTGFWDNIVARVRDGKAEIAYGHHRLVALKEEYSSQHKVNLIIRDLDDEHMIQIMARENMEEWGTNASIEHETIRAVVEAYGAGLVTLPAMSIRTNKILIRYAPSFTQGGDAEYTDTEHPYTAQTLAEFLGWLEPAGGAQKKVEYALTALYFIDEGLLKDSDFDGLSTKQAQAVVEQARQAKDRRESAARVHRQQAEAAKKQAEKAERWREEAKEKQRLLEEEAKRASDAKARDRAIKEAAEYKQKQIEFDETRKLALRSEQSSRKQEYSLKAEGERSVTKVGRAVSVGMKKGEIGFRQARELANRVDTRNGDKARPDIEQFAQRLIGELAKILDPDRDDRCIKLNELVRFRSDLAKDTRINLEHVMERISTRALDYRDQFSGKTVRADRALPQKRS